MAVDESRLPTIEASFADAARAERAIAQLQHQGIDDARIDVEHGVRQGEASLPGRTAAKDRDTVDRMSGAWWTGWLSGALAGLVIGMIIGTVAFGWGQGLFWGIVIGLTVALGAVGGLWGFFAGFAGGATRRPETEEPGTPQLPDAVRVIVRTKPGEEEAVHRILQTKGGTE